MILKKTLCVSQTTSHKKSRDACFSSSQIFGKSLPQPPLLLQFLLTITSSNRETCCMCILKLDWNYLNFQFTMWTSHTPNSSEYPLLGNHSSFWYLLTSRALEIVYQILSSSWWSRDTMLIITSIYHRVIIGQVIKNIQPIERKFDSLSHLRAYVLNIRARYNSIS